MERKKERTKGRSTEGRKDATMDNGEEGRD